jgi:hypothetical protein
MTAKRFATCLNCIDGRVQLPVINWIMQNHHIDYVDMITEPEMDGFLANESNDLGPIRGKAIKSLDRSKTNLIFVVGHHDCIGNPVNDNTHREHLRQALNRIKTEFPQSQAIGLWVDENWKAEQVVE